MQSELEMDYNKETSYHVNLPLITGAYASHCAYGTHNNYSASSLLQNFSANGLPKCQFVVEGLPYVFSSQLVTY